MSEIKPIISIKEARKLLGKNNKDLSDEEIAKLVEDLDFLAKHAIEQFKEKKIKDGKIQVQNTPKLH